MKNEHNLSTYFKGCYMCGVLPEFSGEEIIQTGRGIIWKTHFQYLLVKLELL